MKNFKNSRLYNITTKANYDHSLTEDKSGSENGDNTKYDDGYESKKNMMIHYIMIL